MKLIRVDMKVEISTDGKNCSGCKFRRPGNYCQLFHRRLFRSEENKSLMERCLACLSAERMNKKGDLKKV